MARAHNEDAYRDVLDYRVKEMKTLLIEVTKERTIPFLFKAKKVLSTARSFKQEAYTKSKLTAFLSPGSMRLLETLPLNDLDDFQEETLYQSLLKDKDGR